MRQYLWTLGLIVCVSCSSSDNNANNANNQNNQNNGSDSGTGDQSQMSAGYSACGPDGIGSIVVALDEGFSTVQGQVANGVNPSDVWTTEASAGDCELLVPEMLFCDPACGGGTTCASDGSCVATPANVDGGEMTISGLTAPVSITARPPTYFYNFVGDLPHPAFTADTTATLTAAGETTAGFTLETSGVDELVTTVSDVAIDMGTGANVTWTAGSSNDDVRVELELNIANHGGTPGRIECTVPDSGDFTIPAELVDGLLAKGFSGFPSLRVTRQAAASTDLTEGCVDFRLKSEIVLPVEIPGLVSCSLPEDCPSPQTCLPDLTCG